MRTHTHSRTQAHTPAYTRARTHARAQAMLGDRILVVWTTVYPRIENLPVLGRIARKLEKWRLHVSDHKIFRAVTMKPSSSKMQGLAKLAIRAQVASQAMHSDGGVPPSPRGTASGAARARPLILVRWEIRFFCMDRFRVERFCSCCYWQWRGSVCWHTCLDATARCLHGALRCMLHNRSAGRRRRA